MRFGGKGAISSRIRQALLGLDVKLALRLANGHYWVLL